MFPAGWSVRPLPLTQSSSSHIVVIVVVALSTSLRDVVAYYYYYILLKNSLESKKLQGSQTTSITTKIKNKNSEMSEIVTLIPLIA